MDFVLADDAQPSLTQGPAQGQVQLNESTRIKRHRTNGRIDSGIGWFLGLFLCKALLYFLVKLRASDERTPMLEFFWWKRCARPKGGPVPGAEPENILSTISAGLGHDFFILEALSNALDSGEWYNRRCGWSLGPYTSLYFLLSSKYRRVSMKDVTFSSWISFSWSVFYPPTFIVTPLLRLRGRHLWMWKGPGFP